MQSKNTTTQGLLVEMSSKKIKSPHVERISSLDSGRPPVMIFTSRGKVARKSMSSRLFETFDDNSLRGGVESENMNQKLDKDNTRNARHVNGKITTNGVSSESYLSSTQTTKLRRQAPAVPMINQTADSTVRPPLIPPPKSFLQRQSSLSSSTSSLSSSHLAQTSQLQQSPMTNRQYASDLSLPPPPSDANNNSEDSFHTSVTNEEYQHISHLATAKKARAPEPPSLPSPPPPPSPPPHTPPHSPLQDASLSSSSAASSPLNRFRFPPPPSTPPSPMEITETHTSFTSTSVSSSALSPLETHSDTERKSALSPNEVMDYFDEAIGGQAVSASSYNDTSSNPAFSPVFHFPSVSDDKQPEHFSTEIESSTQISQETDNMVEQISPAIESSTEISRDTEELMESTEMVTKVSPFDYAKDRNTEGSDANLQADFYSESKTNKENSTNNQVDSSPLSPSSEEERKRRGSKSVAVSKLRPEIKTVRQYIKRGYVDELANLFSTMKDEQITSPSSNKAETDFNIRESLEKLESLDKRAESKSPVLRKAKRSNILSPSEQFPRLQSSVSAESLHGRPRSLHTPAYNKVNQWPRLYQASSTNTLYAPPASAETTASTGFDFLAASREIHKHVVLIRSNSRAGVTASNKVNEVKDHSSKLFDSVSNVVDEEASTRSHSPVNTQERRNQLTEDKPETYDTVQENLSAAAMFPVTEVSRADISHEAHSFAATTESQDISEFPHPTITPANSRNSSRRSSLDDTTMSDIENVSTHLPLIEASSSRRSSRSNSPKRPTSSQNSSRSSSRSGSLKIKDKDPVNLGLPYHSMETVSVAAVSPLHGQVTAGSISSGSSSRSGSFKIRDNTDEVRLHFPSHALETVDIDTAAVNTTQSTHSNSSSSSPHKEVSSEDVNQSFDKAFVTRRTSTSSADSNRRSSDREGSPERNDASDFKGAEVTTALSTPSGSRNSSRAGSVRNKVIGNVTESYHAALENSLGLTVKSTSSSTSSRSRSSSVNRDDNQQFDNDQHKASDKHALSPVSLYSNKDAKQELDYNLLVDKYAIEPETNTSSGWWDSSTKKDSLENLQKESHDRDLKNTSMSSFSSPTESQKSSRKSSLERNKMAEGHSFHHGETVGKIPTLFTATQSPGYSRRSSSSIDGESRKENQQLYDKYNIDISKLEHTDTSTVNYLSSELKNQSQEEIPQASVSIFSSADISSRISPVSSRRSSQTSYFQNGRSEDVKGDTASLASKSSTSSATTTPVGSRRTSRDGISAKNVGLYEIHSAPDTTTGNTDASSITNVYVGRSRDSSPGGSIERMDIWDDKKTDSYQLALQSALESKVTSIEGGSRRGSQTSFIKGDGGTSHRSSNNSSRSSSPTQNRGSDLQTEHFNVTLENTLAENRNYTLKDEAATVNGFSDTNGTLGTHSETYVNTAEGKHFSMYNTEAGSKLLANSELNEAYNSETRLQSRDGELLTSNFVSNVNFSEKENTTSVDSMFHLAGLNSNTADHSEVSQSMNVERADTNSFSASTDMYSQPRVTVDSDEDISVTYEKHKDDSSDEDETLFNTDDKPFVEYGETMVDIHVHDKDETMSHISTASQFGLDKDAVVDTPDNGSVSSDSDISSYRNGHDEYTVNEAPTEDSSAFTVKSDAYTFSDFKEGISHTSSNQIAISHDQQKDYVAYVSPTNYETDSAVLEAFSEKDTSRSSRRSSNSSASDVGSGDKKGRPGSETSLGNQEESAIFSNLSGKSNVLTRQEKVTSQLSEDVHEQTVIESKNALDTDEANTNLVVMQLSADAPASTTIDSETPGRLEDTEGIAIPVTNHSTTSPPKDFLAVLDDINIETDITSRFLRRSSRFSGTSSPDKRQSKEGKSVPDDHTTQADAEVVHDLMTKTTLSRTAFLLTDYQAKYAAYKSEPDQLESTSSFTVENSFSDPDITITDFTAEGTKAAVEDKDANHIESASSILNDETHTASQKLIQKQDLDTDLNISYDSNAENMGRKSPVDEVMHASVRKHQEIQIGLFDLSEEKDTSTTRAHDLDLGTHVHVVEPEMPELKYILGAVNFEKQNESRYVNDDLSSLTGEGTKTAAENIDVNHTESFSATLNDEMLTTSHEVIRRKDFDTDLNISYDTTADDMGRKSQVDEVIHGSVRKREESQINLFDLSTETDAATSRAHDIDLGTHVHIVQPEMPELKYILGAVNFDKENEKIEDVSSLAGEIIANKNEKEEAVTSWAHDLDLGTHVHEKKPGLIETEYAVAPVSVQQETGSLHINDELSSLVGKTVNKIDSEEATTSRAYDLDLGTHVHETKPEMPELKYILGAINFERENERRNFDDDVSSLAGEAIVNKNDNEDAALHRAYDLDMATHIHEKKPEMIEAECIVASVNFEQETGSRHDHEHLSSLGEETVNKNNGEAATTRSHDLDLGTHVHVIQPEMPELKYILGAINLEKEHEHRHVNDDLSSLAGEIVNNQNDNEVAATSWAHDLDLGTHVHERKPEMIETEYIVASVNFHQETENRHVHDDLSSPVRETINKYDNEEATTTRAHDLDLGTHVHETKPEMPELKYILGTINFVKEKESRHINDNLSSLAGETAVNKDDNADETFALREDNGLQNEYVNDSIYFTNRKETDTGTVDADSFVNDVIQHSTDTVNTEDIERSNYVNDWNVDTTQDKDQVHSYVSDVIRRSVGTIHTEEMDKSDNVSDWDANTRDDTDQVHSLVNDVIRQSVDIVNTEEINRSNDVNGLDIDDKEDTDQVYSYVNDIVQQSAHKVNTDIHRNSETRQSYPEHDNVDQTVYESFNQLEVVQVSSDARLDFNEEVATSRGHDLDLGTHVHVVKPEMPELKYILGAINSSKENENEHVSDDLSSLEVDEDLSSLVEETSITQIDHEEFATSRGHDLDLGTHVHVVKPEMPELKYILGAINSSKENENEHVSDDLSSLEVDEDLSSLVEETSITQIDHEEFATSRGHDLDLGTHVHVVKPEMPELKYILGAVNFSRQNESRHEIDDVASNTAGNYVDAFTSEVSKAEEHLAFHNEKAPINEYVDDIIQHSVDRVGTEVSKTEDYHTLHEEKIPVDAYVGDIIQHSIESFSTQKVESHDLDIYEDQVTRSHTDLNHSAHSEVDELKTQTDATAFEQHFKMDSNYDSREKATPRAIVEDFVISEKYIGNQSRESYFNDIFHHLTEDQNTEAVKNEDVGEFNEAYTGINTAKPSVKAFVNDVSSRNIHHGEVGELKTQKGVTAFEQHFKVDSKYDSSEKATPTAVDEDFIISEKYLGNQSRESFMNDIFHHLNKDNNTEAVKNEDHFFEIKKQGEFNEAYTGESAFDFLHESRDEELPSSLQDEDATASRYTLGHREELTESHSRDVTGDQTDGEFNTEPSRIEDLYTEINTATYSEKAFVKDVSSADIPHFREENKIESDEFLQENIMKESIYVNNSTAASFEVHQGDHVEAEIDLDNEIRKQHQILSPKLSDDVEYDKTLNFNPDTRRSSRSSISSGHSIQIRDNRQATKETTFNSEFFVRSHSSSDDGQQDRSRQNSLVATAESLFPLEENDNRSLTALQYREHSDTMEEFNRVLDISSEHGKSSRSSVSSIDSERSRHQALATGSNVGLEIAEYTEKQGLSSADSMHTAGESSRSSLIPEYGKLDLEEESTHFRSLQASPYNDNVEGHREYVSHESFGFQDQPDRNSHENYANVSQTTVSVAHLAQTLRSVSNDEESTKQKEDERHLFSRDKFQALRSVFEKQQEAMKEASSLKTTRNSYRLGVDSSSASESKHEGNWMLNRQVSSGSSVTSSDKKEIQGHLKSATQIEDYTSVDSDSDNVMTNRDDANNEHISDLQSQVHKKTVINNKLSYDLQTRELRRGSTSSANSAHSASSEDSSKRAGMDINLADRQSEAYSSNFRSDDHYPKNNLFSQKPGLMNLAQWSTQDSFGNDNEYVQKKKTPSLSSNSSLESQNEVTRPTTSEFHESGYKESSHGLHSLRETDGTQLHDIAGETSNPIFNDSSSTVDEELAFRNRTHSTSSLSSDKSSSLEIEDHRLFSQEKVGRFSPTDDQNAAHLQSSFVLETANVHSDRSSVKSQSIKRSSLGNKDDSLSSTYENFSLREHNQVTTNTTELLAGNVKAPVGQQLVSQSLDREANVRRHSSSGSEKEAKLIGAFLRSNVRSGPAHDISSHFSRQGSEAGSVKSHQSTQHVEHADVTDIVHSNRRASGSSDTSDSGKEDISRRNHSETSLREAHKNDKRNYEDLTSATDHITQNHTLQPEETFTAVSHNFSQPNVRRDSLTSQEDKNQSHIHRAPEDQNHFLSRQANGGSPVSIDEKPTVKTYVVKRSIASDVFEKPDEHLGESVFINRRHDYTENSPDLYTNSLPVSETTAREVTDMYSQESVRQRHSQSSPFDVDSFNQGITSKTEDFSLENARSHTDRVDSRLRHDDGDTLYQIKRTGLDTSPIFPSIFNHDTSIPPTYRYTGVSHEEIHKGELLGSHGLHDGDNFSSAYVPLNENAEKEHGFRLQSRTPHVADIASRVLKSPISPGVSSTTFQRNQQTPVDDRFQFTPIAVSTVSQAVVGDTVGVNIDFPPAGATYSTHDISSSSDEDSKQQRFIVRNVQQTSALKSSHNSSSEIIFANEEATREDVDDIINRSGTLSPRTVVDGPIFSTGKSQKSHLSRSFSSDNSLASLREYNNVSSPRDYAVTLTNNDVDDHSGNLYRVLSVSPNGSEFRTAEAERGRSRNRNSGFSDTKIESKTPRKHHSPERFFKNPKLSLRQEDYDNKGYSSDDEDGKHYHHVTKVYLSGESRSRSEVRSPNHLGNRSTEIFDNGSDLQFQEHHQRYKVIGNLDSSLDKHLVRAQSSPKLDRKHEPFYQESTFTRSPTAQPTSLTNVPATKQTHQSVVNLEIGSNYVDRRDLEEDLNSRYIIKRSRSSDDLRDGALTVAEEDQSQSDRKMWRTGRSKSSETYLGRGDNADGAFEPRDQYGLPRTFVTTAKTHVDNDKMYVVNSASSTPKDSHVTNSTSHDWYTSTIDFNERSPRGVHNWNANHHEEIHSPTYKTEKTVYISNKASPQPNSGNVRDMTREFVFHDYGQGREIVNLSGHEHRSNAQRSERINEDFAEPHILDYSRSTEDLSNDLRVLRGKILIKNRFDSSEFSEDDFDQNANLFDTSFHLGKDNPVYSSDPDIAASLRKEEDRDLSKLVTQDITFETVDKVAQQYQAGRQVQLSPGPQRKKPNLSSLLLSKLALVDSKDIRQTVDVEHHNEEIHGDIRFVHADGEQKESKGTYNFDSVNEKVELTLTQGKANVIIKVIAERVIPTDTEFITWRKSQAIVTRHIEINLQANEQMKHLYKHVMKKTGNSGSVEGSSRLSSTYNSASLSPQERELNSMETLQLFTQILDVAEQQGSRDQTDPRVRHELGQLPASVMDMLY